MTGMSKDDLGWLGYLGMTGMTSDEWDDQG